MLKRIVSSAALAPLLMAGIASAQTTNDIVTSTSTTPGVPNTGAGDVALNAFILGISAMIVVAGALYLYLNRRLVNW